VHLGIDEGLYPVYELVAEGVRVGVEIDLLFLE
jgi:hypothetical protein